MIHLTIEFIPEKGKRYTKQYVMCELKQLNNDTIRMVVKDD